MGREKERQREKMRETVSNTTHSYPHSYPHTHTFVRTYLICDIISATACLLDSLLCPDTPPALPVRLAPDTGKININKKKKNHNRS